VTFSALYEGHRKVSWGMHSVGCTFDRPVLIQGFCTHGMLVFMFLIKCKVNKSKYINIRNFLAELFTANEK
jgi:hypothetical protein